MQWMTLPQRLSRFALSKASKANLIVDDQARFEGSPHLLTSRVAVDGEAENGV